jgi:hypothetical protein
MTIGAETSCPPGRARLSSHGSRRIHGPMGTARITLTNREASDNVTGAGKADSEPHGALFANRNTTRWAGSVRSWISESVAAENLYAFSQARW